MLWRLRQEDCRELSLETPHSASWNLKYTDKLTVYIVHNAQPRDGQNNSLMMTGPTDRKSMVCIDAFPIHRKKFKTVE